MDDYLHKATFGGLYGKKTFQSVGFIHLGRLTVNRPGIEQNDAVLDRPPPLLAEEERKTGRGKIK